MIDYRIEVGNAHAHRFLVTLRIAQPQARQRLSLPVWIPGSYLVREFARHLSPLSAQQGNKAVDVVQLDKASWEVDCRGKGALTVIYEVYAFDTSVRAAFLDSRRGFFNGTSVFLKAEGFEGQPQQLKITGLPKGWGVATGLPAIKVNAQGLGDYRAQDYDSLVDHPVELGTFWRGTFIAKGVPHEFIVSGASADLGRARLPADTQAHSETQHAVGAGPRQPVGRLPVPGPHGLGQDRADQGPGRVHVRRRERHHPPRHERIHGEAQRQPDDRGPSRLCRL